MRANSVLATRRLIMRKLGMAFDRETLDPSCDRRVHVYRIAATDPPREI